MEKMRIKKKNTNEEDECTWQIIQQLRRRRQSERDMPRDLTDIKNKQLFLQSNRYRITGDDATRQQRERETKAKNISSLGGSPKVVSF